LTDGWLADLDAPAFTIGIRFADGVWRIIEAAVPDDVTDEMLPARAQRLATSLFGSSAWRETLWTAAYRKHERRAPRYFDRRVVLAGDAAHLNSPAGGQGLNAGLADVAELANALLSAFAAPDRVDGLLGAYERERIAAFDHDIRGFTDRLEMMESAPAWLRKLGFSMVGVLRALGIERHIAAKLSMLEAD
jgi:2-polyprenyl-6-methoxyphenol hydroxylase-like FAD-dependent oxidoreductase